MKTRLPLFPLVTMLAIFCFSVLQPSIVKGQMLYGLTSAGGSDNLGTIFHYDQAAASQVVDYSLPLLEKDCLRILIL
jgi:uncharacterized repeat protein (TIGR03803 family)